MITPEQPLSRKMPKGCVLAPQRSGAWVGMEASSQRVPCFATFGHHASLGGATHWKSWTKRSLYLPESLFPNIAL
jgi:hypothetical protein